MEEIFSIAYLKKIFVQLCTFSYISMMSIFTGISETERNHRKEKNILSTEVNFTRWIFEVKYVSSCLASIVVQMLGTLVFAFLTSLDVRVRVLIWRVFSATLPPLFYILALNRDVHKLLKHLISPQKTNTVYPVTQ